MNIITDWSSNKCVKVSLEEYKSVINKIDKNAVVNCYTDSGIVYNGEWDYKNQRDVNYILSQKYKIGSYSIKHIHADDDSMQKENAESNVWVVYDKEDVAGLVFGIDNVKTKCINISIDVYSNFIKSVDSNVEVIVYADSGVEYNGNGWESKTQEEVNKLLSAYTGYNIVHIHADDDDFRTDCESESGIWIVFE